MYWLTYTSVGVKKTPLNWKSNISMSFIQGKFMWFPSYKKKKIGFSRSQLNPYNVFGEIQVLLKYGAWHFLIIMQSKQWIKKIAKINKRLNYFYSTASKNNLIRSTNVTDCSETGKLNQPLSQYLTDVFSVESRFTVSIRQMSSLLSFELTLCKQ